MRTNTLRALLDSGATAVNAWTSLDSPYAAEVLSHCGFDAVTIDLQHGMFGLDRVVGLLQAVSTGPATPMVRCASHDPAEIGKLLDAGAYGIICPAIDDAAQCTRLVAACRYPPLGTRSYGPSRGLLYGGPDYVAHADTTVLTWAMIESAAALDNLDAILAVDGLDGLYVGPNDLALALGLPPVTGDLPPRVATAIGHVVDRAHAAGRVVGVFANSGPQARALADRGVDLVTPGNDVGLLRAAAADRLALIRSVRPVLAASY